MLGFVLKHWPSIGGGGGGGGEEEEEEEGEGEMGVFRRTHFSQNHV